VSTLVVNQFSVSNQTITYNVDGAMWGTYPCFITIEDNFPPNRTFTFNCSGECNFTNVAANQTARPKLRLLVSSRSSSVSFNQIDFFQLYLHAEIGSIFVANSTIDAGGMLLKEFDARIITDNPLPALVHQISSNFYIKTADNLTTSVLEVNPCYTMTESCLIQTGFVLEQNDTWVEKNNIMYLMSTTIQNSLKLMSDTFVNDKYLNWRYLPYGEAQPTNFQVVMEQTRLMLNDMPSYMRNQTGNPNTVSSFISMDVWNFDVKYYPMNYISQDVTNLTLFKGSVYGSLMSHGHQYLDDMVSNYTRNFFEYGRQHYALFVNVLPFNVSFLFTRAPRTQILPDRIDFTKKLFNSNLEQIYINLPVLALSYNLQNELLTLMQAQDRMVSHFSNHPPVKEYTSAVLPNYSLFGMFIQQYIWLVDADDQNILTITDQWFQIQQDPSGSYTFWSLGLTRKEFETIILFAVMVLTIFSMLTYLTLFVYKTIEILEYSNKIKFIRNENKDRRLLQSQMDDLSQNKLILILRILFNTNYTELLYSYFYYYHSKFEDAIKSFGRVFFERVEVNHRHLQDVSPVFRKSMAFEEVKAIYEHFCFINDLEVRDLSGTQARAMFESFDYQLTSTNQGTVMIENFIVFDSLELNDLETDTSDCADSLDLFYKYNCRVYIKRHTAFDDFLRMYKKFCEKYKLYEIDFSQEFLSAKYGLKYIVREILVLEPKPPKAKAKYTYYIRPIGWDHSSRNPNHVVSASGLLKIPGLRILAMQSVFFLLMDIIFYQNISAQIGYLFFSNDDFFNNFIRYYTIPFPEFFSSYTLSFVNWSLMLLMLFHRIMSPELSFQLPIITQGVFGIMCSTILWIGIYFQKFVQFYALSYYFILIIRGWGLSDYNIIENDIFGILVFLGAALVIVLILINFFKIWSFGKIIERNLIKSIADSIRADVSTRTQSVQVKEKEGGWVTELEEFFNVFPVCQQVVKNKTLLTPKQLKLLVKNLIQSIGFDSKPQDVDLAVNFNIKRFNKKDGVVSLNKFFFGTLKNRLTDAGHAPVEVMFHMKHLKRLFAILITRDFSGQPIVAHELLNEMAEAVKSHFLSTHTKELETLLAAFAINSAKNKAIRKSHKFAKFDLLTNEFMNLFRRLLGVTTSTKQWKLHGHTTIRALKPVRINRIFAREFSGIHDYELFYRLIEFKLNHFMETTFLLDKDPKKLAETLLEWINLSSQMSAKTIMLETVNNMLTFDTFRANYLTQPLETRQSTNREVIEFHFHEFMFLLFLAADQKNLPLIHSCYDTLQTNFFFCGSAEDMGMKTNEHLGMILCINGLRSPYNLEFVEFICHKHGFQQYTKFCSFVYVLLNYEDLEQLWILAEFLPESTLKLFIYLSDPEATLTADELETLVREAKLADKSKQNDLRKLIKDRQVQPLLEFKAIVGDIASFNVKWTMMELVIDAVNKQKDRNSFMNSLMKAFIHLLADKSFLIFLEGYVRLVIRVGKAGTKKLTIKKRFKFWEFIFPKKEVHFNQFEGLFQPHLMFDRGSRTDDVRRSGLEGWVLRRYPKPDKYIKSKVETELMILSRTSESMAQYQSSLINLMNEEDSQLTGIFLKNAVFGIKRFNYLEARKLTELGFAVFWRTSLSKEPSDEGASAVSSQRIDAETRFSEEFDEDAENEPLLPGSVIADKQALGRSLIPDPVLPLPQPNITAKRITNSKMFDFLQSVAKSVLTRDPIPLISFYQTLHRKSMFISFLVRRYFQALNQQKLTDDLYLFSSLRKLSVPQMSVVNLFFILQHDTFSNNDHIGKLFNLFGFDKELLDAILFLKRKRFSLEKVIGYLADKDSKMPGRRGLAKQLIKYPSTALVMHPNLTDFTLDKFHGQKDAIYYLIKAKSFCSKIRANFDRLPPGKIIQILKTKPVRVLLDFFKIDPEEFKILLFIATNVFRDFEIDQFCQLLSTSNQDKQVAKNFAFIKRPMSLHKANSCYNDLLGNSRLFEVMGVSSLGAWLYVLSVKQDFYAFFKLVKTKLPVFEEVFGLREVMYGAFWLALPDWLEEDAKVRSVSTPKLVNTRSYYRTKLWHINSPMTQGLIERLDNVIVPRQVTIQDLHKDPKDTKDNNHAEMALPWLSTQVILYNLIKQRQAESNSIDFPMLRLVLRRCLLSVLKRMNKFKTLNQTNTNRTPLLEGSQLLVVSKMFEAIAVERRNLNSNFMKSHQNGFNFNINDPGFIRYVKKKLGTDKLGQTDRIAFEPFNRHLVFLFYQKMQKDQKSSKILDNLHAKLKDPDYCCWTHRLDQMSPNCITGLFLDERYYTRFKVQVFEHLFKLSKNIERPVRFDADTQSEAERNNLMSSYYEQRHALLSAVYGFLMRSIMKARPQFSQTLLLQKKDSSNKEMFPETDRYYTELFRMLMASCDIHSLALNGRLWTLEQKRLMTKALQLISMNVLRDDTLVSSAEAQKYLSLVNQLNREDPNRPRLSQFILNYFMETLPLSEEIGAPLSTSTPLIDELLNEEPTFKDFLLSHLVGQAASDKAVSNFLSDCANLPEHIPFLNEITLVDYSQIKKEKTGNISAERMLDIEVVATIESLINLRTNYENFEPVNLKAQLGKVCKSNGVNLVDLLGFLVSGFKEWMFNAIPEIKRLTPSGAEIIFGERNKIDGWLKQKIASKLLPSSFEKSWNALFEASYAQDRRKTKAPLDPNQEFDPLEIERQAVEKFKEFGLLFLKGSENPKTNQFLSLLYDLAFGQSFSATENLKLLLLLLPETYLSPKRSEKTISLVNFCSLIISGNFQNFSDLKEFDYVTCAEHFEIQNTEDLRIFSFLDCLFSPHIKQEVLEEAYYKCISFGNYDLFSANFDESRRLILYIKHLVTGDFGAGAVLFKNHETRKAYAHFVATHFFLHRNRLPSLEARYPDLVEFFADVYAYIFLHFLMINIKIRSKLNQENVDEQLIIREFKVVEEALYSVEVNKVLRFDRILMEEGEPAPAVETLPMRTVTPKVDLQIQNFSSEIRKLFYMFTKSDSFFTEKSNFVTVDDAKIMEFVRLQILLAKNPSASNPDVKNCFIALFGSSADLAQKCFQISLDEKSVLDAGFLSWQSKPHLHSIITRLSKIEDPFEKDRQGQWPILRPVIEAVLSLHHERDWGRRLRLLSTLFKDTSLFTQPFHLHLTEMLSQIPVNSVVQSLQRIYLLPCVGSSLTKCERPGLSDLFSAMSIPQKDQDVFFSICQILTGEKNYFNCVVSKEALSESPIFAETRKKYQQMVWRNTFFISSLFFSYREIDKRMFHENKRMLDSRLAKNLQLFNGLLFHFYELMGHKSTQNVQFLKQFLVTVYAVDLETENRARNVLNRLKLFHQIRATNVSKEYFEILHIEVFWQLVEAELHAVKEKKSLGLPILIAEFIFGLLCIVHLMVKKFAFAKLPLQSYIEYNWFSIGFIFGTISLLIIRKLFLFLE
jgi:hypothetical protein